MRATVSGADDACGSPVPDHYTARNLPLDHAGHPNLALLLALLLRHALALVRRAGRLRPLNHFIDVKFRATVIVAPACHVSIRAYRLVQGSGWVNFSSKHSTVDSVLKRYAVGV